MPTAPITMLAVAACLGPTACAQAPDSGALWRIVHDGCVPDQEQHASPAPCRYVNLAHGDTAGYAVLKDRRGHTQFLLIPTRRSPGIEDPALLAPGAPNYWQAAWAARTYVYDSAGGPLPRNAVGMAINSRWARSQNQLHIHVDCLRPDVVDQLTAHLAAIGDTWSAFPFPLSGHTYTARRVHSVDLTDANPFVLLSTSIPAGQPGMADRTLVVVGATFPTDSGFILLSDVSDPAHADAAHGEDLQDHTCAIAAYPNSSRRRDR
jgi:CDP-diacylglycerol pyrophosphatase